MRKLFSLICILIFLAACPFILGAQPGPADVETGLEFEVQGSSELLGYIGSINDKHYVLTENKGSIWVLEFDDNLEFIQEKAVYDHKETDPQTYIQGMIFHGNILVFTRAYDSKKKTNNLCLHVVDPDQLDPEVKYRILARVKRKPSFNPGITGDLYYPLPELDSYGLRISPDGNTLLAFTFLPSRGSEGELLFAKLIDSELDSIWEGQLMHSVKDKVFQIEDVKVDNDGNIYTIGTEFPKTKYHKKSMVPDYTYLVTVFRNKGEKRIDLPIKLRGKTVGDMSFALTGENNLSCYGTVTKPGYFEVEGFFVYTYDRTTGEELNHFTTDKELEFWPEFLDRKLNKLDKTHMMNNGAGYYLYQFREPYLRPDGGYYIIAEQFAVKYRDNDAYEYGVDLYEIRAVSSIVHDYIFVISIDSTGAPVFKIQLPKLQGGTFVTNDNLSFGTAYDGENLYFIYNDILKNLELEAEKKRDRFDNLSGSAVIVTKVDPKGKFSTGEVFDYTGVNMGFDPVMSFQLNENEVIIPGESVTLMSRLFNSKKQIQLMRIAVAK